MVGFGFESNILLVPSFRGKLESGYSFFEFFVSG